MIGSKITLVAATATKIASSPAGGNYSVRVQTALTDIAFGGPTVTVAAGFKPGSAIASPGTDIPCGRDDLWAISTGGGDIMVLYPENG